jgi:hypothetical protein
MLGEMQMKTDSEIVGTARCAVRTPQRGVPTTAMNTFLDARSNLCYTQVDAEQDHNFDGDGRRAFCGSGGSRLAIMHPLQFARSTRL